VRALANHMGLDRFAILGVSGGGPYAVACAHALPREMLSAVGVIAGGPPVRRD
jgi:pimeloyl-ACP methyl ester carboxylesterase